MDSYRLANARSYRYIWKNVYSAIVRFEEGTVGIQHHTPLFIVYSAHTYLYMSRVDYTLLANHRIATFFLIGHYCRVKVCM